ncbi:Man1-Src1p-C-terminal domain-containing protein [Xylogone sp. PMI_703]|nr:Man1-Src1p-C-terminal domain-containing protein [Xylogone sp. PMI_703]
MSQSDTESLDYLQTGFDPATLTVPRLRSILVQYNISYPSNAKKAQLVEIFNSQVLPQSRRILAARARARRTSKGITNADDSETENHANEELMPPPPLPHAPRSVRKSSPVKIKNEESEEEPSMIRGPIKKTPRISSKHARASDTETGTDMDPVKKSARKLRKSESATAAPPVQITPIPVPKNEEEPGSDNKEIIRKSSRRESAFTYDNPFQSGSSPISDLRTPGSERRKTSNSLIKDPSKRRVSSTVRRKTMEPKISHDEFHPPTSTTFEIPVSAVGELKTIEKHDIEAGEEFTPEEQLDLIKEESINGVKTMRSRSPKDSSRLSRPLWALFFTLLCGYATWYRQQKLAVGYCGVGRPSEQLIPETVQVYLPTWAIQLVEPQCEVCPQHAYCSENLQTQCEADYVLKPHPLSFSGLVPLPPTCEPDGEKVRRVKAVADRAVEELRQRRAKWECGTLTDETGAPQATVEINADELKKEVSQKRRRGMSEAEFEELWAGAIGEIGGRDEVEMRVEGTPNHHIYLSSSSLARLPLACAIRRTVRLTLAKHRLQITLLGLLSIAVLYVRSIFTTRARVAAQVPQLVSLTLDRLADQVVAAKEDSSGATDRWISIGQLRDDVLRDEHNVSKREQIWSRVRKIVEMNANVRSSQREDRNGEISRVWEWIGSVGESNERRKRKSGGPGRLSWGTYGEDNGDEGRSPPRGFDATPEAAPRRWEEGKRPVF